MSKPRDERAPREARPPVSERRWDLVNFHQSPAPLALRTRQRRELADPEGPGQTGIEGIALPFSITLGRLRVVGVEHALSPSLFLAGAGASTARTSTSGIGRSKISRMSRRLSARSQLASLREMREGEGCA